ncbi:hypothetical protein E2C01_066441 [Portunus trituberculatus]|uniref:Uncharacterized protein n=1 Tax=Portunus trituberculatus TaxID=210409 RepID=A0A5B7HTV5_PORTR|nr:hypothetical protein [Portunus trituberculatus]
MAAIRCPWSGSGLAIWAGFGLEQRFFFRLTNVHSPAASSSQSPSGDLLSEAGEAGVIPEDLRGCRVAPLTGLVGVFILDEGAVTPVHCPAALSFFLGHAEHRSLEMGVGVTGEVPLHTVCCWFLKVTNSLLRAETVAKRLSTGRLHVEGKTGQQQQYPSVSPGQMVQDKAPRQSPCPSGLLRLPPSLENDKLPVLI